MAAPIMDKVIPPIVFLVGMLTCFVVVVGAMTPTIESNLQAPYQTGEGWSEPDYFLMFANSTWIQSGVYEPDPLLVDSSMTIHGTPPFIQADYYHFWNNGTAGEKDHPIRVLFITRYSTDLSGDRHEIFFEQHGGWAGVQTYRDKIHLGDWDKSYANSSDPSWFAIVNLRHGYELVLRPGIGSNNTFSSFMSWNFNLTMVLLLNQTTSLNPWGIVFQLFTYQLPDIPLFLQILIMAPIQVTIAIVSYALVRSVFPF